MVIPVAPARMLVPLLHTIRPNHRYYFLLTALITTMNPDLINAMRKELAQMVFKYEYDSSPNYFKYKTGKDGKPTDVILKKLEEYTDAEIDEIHSWYSKKLGYNKAKEQRERFIKKLFGK